MNYTEEYVTGCLCWLTNKIDLNFEQSEQELAAEFVAKCKCSRHPTIKPEECWTKSLSKKEQMDLRSKIFSGYFGDRVFYKDKKGGVK